MHECHCCLFIDIYHVQGILLRCENQIEGEKKEYKEKKEDFPSERGTIPGNARKRKSKSPDFSWISSPFFFFFFLVSRLFTWK